MFEDNSILTTLGLIVVMGLLFYLLLIRPQKRRQKEQAQLMDALGPGATVMLSSGIIVKVIEVGDTQVLVELAPGLEMTVLKQVIINTSATDEFAVDEDDHHHNDDFSFDADAEVPDSPADIIDPASADSDLGDQDRPKE